MAENKVTIINRYKGTTPDDPKHWSKQVLANTFSYSQKSIKKVSMKMHIMKIIVSH